MRTQALGLTALAIIAVACIGGLSPATRPAVKASDISEITITRLGGPGAPSDVLVLHSDGSATYEGKHDVEHVGTFKGRLPEGFDGPVFPMVAEHFADLMSKPFSTGKPTSGCTPVMIQVKWTGGVRERTDWCPGVDERVWSCEMIARGVADEIKWEK